jgi:hyperpolarization activated cyclic nucleotide-gated potassium channel 2
MNLLGNGTSNSTVTPSSEDSSSSTLAIGMRILRVLKFLRFIKVIKLLRILKLKKIFGKLEDYITLSSAMVSLYEVMKLTGIMLFFAHWLACIWHLIADYEENAGNPSWLSSQKIYGSDWYIRYTTSLYWSVATMTTVGYGDVVPVTSIEKIFGIIVMLLAACIFAYIINSIGGIFVTMDLTEKEMREKLGQANQFLKSNEIPKDLQARVRKYLEYKYERESSQVDEK